MGTLAPSALELWRANAADRYRTYLTRQPLGTQVFEDMNAQAWRARIDHNDERLMQLLCATGDSECIACTMRYEAAKAEK